MLAVDEDEEEDAELFCICQLPHEDGYEYIGCDECEQWFHFACVGVDQVEAATWIESYVCDACAERTGRATKRRSADHPLVQLALEAERDALPFTQQPAEPSGIVLTMRTMQSESGTTGYEIVASRTDISNGSS